ncbi:GTPase ObgE [Candidatus Shapirobacteria bacterium CG09_land_8_20_14_0_10_39_12]|uniref:GTPase Obg n=1 Tax=Candidatus Shapirobacteria bacterium CG09_land_8_20_14_0_10_39_12 TaxID=1974885 RepID=A0A2H0WPN4_9BACT|nr:MAG: GTPase ObgE [Candidatus Shapirobacteria bacterium CG09_land_8_20_14_0_10_39_12]
MLVDEVEIKVSAGDGGDGKVGFHHEKNNPKGGPDGGDGGNGGDVYFIGVSNITALKKFRFQKTFKAKNGQPGGSNKKTGASADDLEIKIPTGTVIKDLESKEIWEINEAGEKILMAKGGKGGRGNWQFRSATNQTPMEFEEGTAGKERRLFLELRLIADIGLVGLPNAGKTSLLNELTAASAKIAAYPFTTLEPNLGGTENGLIIADLPGLIEGAHTGKGLGIKFLKHIKRTKMIVHCLAADSADVLTDYETIRKELGSYDPELLNKKEIVLITKTDLVTKKELEDIIKKLKERLKESDILGVSIYDYESVENLKRKFTV